MRESKLVCFDVDGTLVDGSSWYLLTEGLGVSVEEHQRIYDQANRGEITFAEGDRRLTDLYLAGGRATRKFIRKIFQEVTPRREARDLIVCLKNRGYRIGLISGSMDLYVREVARQLKVDDWFANSYLEFGQSGVLKRIHYRGYQGAVKVRQLKEVAAKYGLSVREVFFVGDSENDIEVFRATGRGIAVHSSSGALKQVAWRVVNDLNEVKEIL